MSYGKRRNARLRRKRFDARVWITSTLKETYLEGYKEGWNDHATEVSNHTFSELRKVVDKIKKGVA